MPLQKPPLTLLPLRTLVAIPIILALLTAWQLFLHSDLNLAMLFSQCHSHARLAALSRIPLVGPVLCYLTSFFQASVASARAGAVMAETLAFVAGLLTVYTVEGARICNRSAVLIAYPAGPMLVFNLIGGAVVWQLLLVPAFFHHHQAILAQRQNATPQALERAQDTHPALGPKLRYFTNSAETLAIPVGVALGFILPSALLLFLGTPWAAGLWLFSPLYVSAIRIAVRRLVALSSPWITFLRPENAQPTSLHLESSRTALLGVYLLPLTVSALAHWNLIWNLTAHFDDCQEMTRSVLRFVVVDMAFVWLTVVYWLFVEVGWQVTTVVVGIGLVAGPGAGLCVGWIYREQKMMDSVFVLGSEEERVSDEHEEETESDGYQEQRQSDEHRDEGENNRRQTDENTPLLG
ncbi:hypothetical protein TD95_002898 [Thielaviopsis punctulata]|uniref:Uncharacterized protein n=1 Tax=Thielaviopsis punctulata TaxID=72032 RepID=A0A0F4ZF86_9PEZI|nr:hypothetical protein TD95_002898 [Thielaviopsis punctulata]